jgi:TPR repeat protein
MKQFLKLLCAGMMVLAFAPASSGGNLEDGLDAFNSGNFDKAYELYLLEAEKGDAIAQTNLGTLYSLGKGAPQDDVQAVRWFRKAAEQGEVIAQSILGVYYARGQGVAKDDKEAAKWFTLAAEQGDSLSQLSLGIMYDVGRGVAQNQIIAWAWYVLAMENGEEDARNFIEMLQKTMSSEEINMAELTAEQFRSRIVK